MSEKRNIEGEVVFAISPQGQGDGGAPVLLFGIPAQAWEHMKDGRAHTFDLISLGQPIKVIMYGAETHAAAMKMMIERVLAVDPDAVFQPRATISRPNELRRRGRRPRA